MPHIKFSILNPAMWRDISSDTPIPLQQYWAYGKALEAFGSHSFQIEIYNENNQKIALALALQRRFLGLLSLTTIFRGPVWLSDVDSEEKMQALKALRKKFPKIKWNFLALLPEIDITNPDVSSLNAAGYKKVMTGFSTAWVDLRPDEKTIRMSLKGKWRNQLKKAENSDIQIAVGGRKPHQYSWLLEQESEQRSSRGYQATPLGLVPAYVDTVKNSADAVVSVIASSKKTKIAGALFLLHGNSATYHIGWAGNDARDLNAQNLVLWHGILTLRERGIRFLDLGGLNTADLAGIARFKLGTGASPVTLAGAYI
ncbi:peptidoglycan bridge formation glycyltransferase FemA/FemB family protein [Kordiimonas sp. SCSIO 12610]|uniref:lipid II:glycine glycyltransferase FemX n=1 Tax=Kordiimonas sp. SCSIO 12610 TaxID=2829597 RepID=UPI00210C4331|nr:peptidoglycan bridge formation glycyltransferase FemA/FemB family protein [Kordiimonas sp. SCSIO 12610]UTW55374.1 peptidoglycan bridge formation glycyltransferase FemA/FemB family protein [Kordiimonas sp. SCSIO 12610]